MDNIAISVEHVKKIYKLYDRNRDRLKDALGFSKKPLGKEHYALNDVSFQVGQGETVGIIGTNGSGKSTILNLIGRYFDIQKGQILIDGIDIHEIDLDVLRGAIGQVQQDVFIFTGDIKSNISLNNEAISPDDVRNCRTDMMNRLQNAEVLYLPGSASFCPSHGHLLMIRRSLFSMKQLPTSIQKPKH